MMASKAFSYEADVDGYRCPQGQLLTYATTDRTGYRHYKCDPAICRSCPLLASCTSSRNATRLIIRHVWAEPVSVPMLIGSPRGASASTSVGRRPWNAPLPTPNNSTATATLASEASVAVTCQCLLAAAAQNIKKIALALAPRPILA